MADVFKIKLTVVVCTDCQNQNVVLDQNKPPKFCSQCCKELPSPTSADHNTKESVQILQKSQTGQAERVFGDNSKPTTDLFLDKKSGTGPPNEKPPDKLPIQESCDHEARNDKDDDKHDDKHDEDKSPSNGSDDDKPPNNETHGNKPSDGRPFSDKPTGIKPNNQSSTVKSPSDKPTHNPLSNKPCGDGSSGDKHDENKLVRIKARFHRLYAYMYSTVVV